MKMSDDATVWLVMLGWFLVIFTITMVKTLRTPKEVAKPSSPNPYLCAGCGHHESFHEEADALYRRGVIYAGCQKAAEYYTRCACQRFVSSDPTMYLAMK
jgi:hypothetical protein